MRKGLIAAALCATLGVAGAAHGQTPSAEEPGWTGVTDPAGVITARQMLMGELGVLIAPLDLFAVGEDGDMDQMKNAAASIGSLVLITPHLFPPTTNVYQQDDAPASTVALPLIWEDFESFSVMAEITSDIAFDALGASDEEEMRDAAMALRASCDACHATFMEEYAPPSFGDPSGVDIDALFPSGN